MVAYQSVCTRKIHHNCANDSDCFEPPGLDFRYTTNLSSSEARSDYFGVYVAFDVVFDLNTVFVLVRVYVFVLASVLVSVCVFVRVSRFVHGLVCVAITVYSCVFVLSGLFLPR